MRTPTNRPMAFVIGQDAPTSAISGLPGFASVQNPAQDGKAPVRMTREQYRWNPDPSTTDCEQTEGLTFYPLEATVLRKP